MSLTIDAVLGLGSNSLHVCPNRYGGGFAAFISNDDYVERIINGLTGGSSFYEELSNSFVFARWYPIAYGGTVAKALQALENSLNSSPLSGPTADARYTLNMLLSRIGGKDGHFIRASTPSFLLKYIVGPCSNEWVDELSDLLDKAR